jgi:hypothetical protein
MIGALKRILIGLLSPLGGIGAASIGGLPGAPKGQTEEEKPIWVPWGGRHLRIPGIEPSERAFERGAYGEAYRSLRRVRACVRQGQIEARAPFRAQLYNNLAVSAHKRSQAVDDTVMQQRLRSAARYYINHAAQIPTSSWELAHAIRRNHDLIDPVW